MTAEKYQDLPFNKSIVLVFMLFLSNLIYVQSLLNAWIIVQPSTARPPM